MLRCYEYRLPFRETFRTAASEFTHRSGIILHYQQGDIDLASEAAPLPGFSKESLEDVKRILTRHQQVIERFLNNLKSISDLRSGLQVPELNVPSIQFAVSFLGASILAKRKQKAIAGLFDRPKRHRIYVNAVAGSMPEKKLKKRLISFAESGFRVIKLKAAGEIEELAGVMESVSEKYPDLFFRLDANRSWPLETLQERTKSLAHLPIEYVEEPSRIANDLELREMLVSSRLPVALDESIQGPDHLGRLLSEQPDLTFVIKPMLFGNFIHLLETIEANRGSCKQIIVTTALESSVGRSIVAECAALFGDPDRSHGLRTGQMFERDILPDQTDTPVLDSAFFRSPAYRSFSDAERSQFEPL